MGKHWAGGSEHGTLALSADGTALTMVADRFDMTGETGGLQVYALPTYQRPFEDRRREDRRRAPLARFRPRTCEAAASILTNVSAMQLRLATSPCIVHADASETALNLRDAALLAWLALEGTDRANAAGRPALAQQQPTSPAMPCASACSS